MPTAVTDSLKLAAGLWLLLINLAALALMGRDKALARREGGRRISGRALFLTALLGGSAGAILGMQLFRHKTRHWYFAVGMPAILIAQLALAWLILRTAP